MVDLKKIGRYIGAVLISGAALVASYGIGVAQNPSYSQLPKRQQESIQESIKAIPQLVNASIVEFRNGKLNKAIEELKEVRTLLDMLQKYGFKKENAQYSQLVFRYECLFNDIETVNRYILALKENSLRTDRQAILRQQLSSWGGIVDLTAFLNIPSAQLRKACGDDNLLRDVLATKIALMSDYIDLCNGLLKKGGLDSDVESYIKKQIEELKKEMTTATEILSSLK